MSKSEVAIDPDGLARRPSVFDMVLRGGTLIDPSHGLHAAGDLALAGGHIAAVLPPGAPAQTAHVLDVGGLLVVPGLIDMHVHVFAGVIHFGVDPDECFLARGVTTALDLGSSGSLTIEGMRRYGLEMAQTRLFTLMNISAKGMLGCLHTLPQIGDLDDLRYCDVPAAVRAIEQHRDCVLGVKVRLTDVLADGGKNELPALLRAREAADSAGVPLVIHMPDSTLPLPRILAEMRGGDLLTHCYHGRRCGILDQQGNVLPELREKQAEGLLLDVGHGVGSFSFRVARAALEQGIRPDFISSDLHQYNLSGPVYDLVTTMDKFLHLGLTLDEVIASTTQRPARFLGLEGRIGTLQAGSLADITVLERQEGSFPLTDTKGVTEIGRQHLEPRYVFKGGRRVGVLPRPSEDDKWRRWAK